MDYEFRVVEKVSVSKQEVIKRDTLKIYDIEKPESILFSCAMKNRFLFSKVQSAFLAEQAVLIDSVSESAQSVEQNLQVWLCAIEIPCRLQWP